MRFKTVLAVLAMSLLFSGIAYAYEFHLLSGMVIKGDLVSFGEGRFNVNTDFGSVNIESGKLDYIIINEADGKVHCEAGALPGMTVDPNSGAGAAAPEPVVPADRQKTQAVDEVAPVPAPLPVPLEGFSIGSGKTYLPGAFTGGAKDVAPQ